MARESDEGSAVKGRFDVSFFPFSVRVLRRRRARRRSNFPFFLPFFPCCLRGEAKLSSAHHLFFLSRSFSYLYGPSPGDALSTAEDEEGENRHLPRLLLSPPTFPPSFIFSWSLSASPVFPFFPPSTQETAKDEGVEEEVERLDLLLSLLFFFLFASCLTRFRITAPVARTEEDR